jgi:aminomethyltransferase
MQAPRRTPLYDFHVAHGGRLVDFAGWEMPVQYRSILEEHKAVRRTAGLFDVSHMGEVEVRGPDGQKFLNFLLTNDVSKMYPGRVVYSPMCNSGGGVVDDLLVYQKTPEEHLICINAGNIEKDMSWMRKQAAGFEVEIINRSDEYALIAVQGPAAANIVQSVSGAKLGLLKYYHFVEGTVGGIHCLISRTGYTGEDGFELYHAAGDAPALAATLVETGKAFGLELAGLGARDSLRLEAGYPLYGHELSDEISPLAAGLGWTVKLNKAGDFVGRESLEREHAHGSVGRVLHFRTGDRRIARAETPVLTTEGVQVGRVVSGTLSPMLNVAIGSAWVESGAAGLPLSVDLRGAMVRLVITRPPFVVLKRN